jgi:hypothetical protein
MELPRLELLALDAGLQLQALARTRGAILAVPAHRDKIFIWEPLRTYVQFKGESTHRTFAHFKGESSHRLRQVKSMVFSTTGGEKALVSRRKRMSHKLVEKNIIL